MFSGNRSINLFAQPPCALLERRNEMPGTNHRENRLRQLLGLTLLTAMLTNLFAVTSYSGTRSRSYGFDKTNRTSSHLSQPQTPTLRENGKIAFASNRDGNWEIYVMNPDGTGQTRLTNHQASDENPAFAPDGTRIAFASTRDSNLNFSTNEIYLMNADGSQQTRLTQTLDGEQSYQPTWSPNGAKLAYIRLGLATNRIILMNADGSGPTTIYETTLYLSQSAWSPDGTNLTFAAGDDF